MQAHDVTLARPFASTVAECGGGSVAVRGTRCARRTYRSAREPRISYGLPQAIRLSCRASHSYIRLSIPGLIVLRPASNRDINYGNVGRGRGGGGAKAKGRRAAGVIPLPILRGPPK